MNGGNLIVRIMFAYLLPIVWMIIQLNHKEFDYVQNIGKILTLVDNVSMTELVFVILYVDAMCKESQFYSVPFGQALASMAQPKSHLSYPPKNFG